MKTVRGLAAVGEEVFTEASGFRTPKAGYRGGLIVPAPDFLCFALSDLEKLTDRDIISEIRNGVALAIPEKGDVPMARYYRLLSRAAIPGQEKALDKIADRLPALG